MKKQFIAKLLVLALVLSMVPVSIVAANAAGAAGSDRTCGADDTCGRPGSSGGYTAPDTTVRVDEPVSADGVIEVKVVAGTATVALNAKAVESLADLAKDGEITLEIKAEGATKIDVSFSAKALTAVAKETGADLTIKSNVATITIPNAVLANEFSEFGSVRITAQATAYNVGFSIQAGGKALKNIKGLKVEF